MCLYLVLYPLSQPSHVPKFIKTVNLSQWTLSLSTQPVGDDEGHRSLHGANVGGTGKTDQRKRESLLQSQLLNILTLELSSRAY